MRSRFLLFCFLICSGIYSYAQQPAYKNKLLSVPQRVKDLLQRMTPEEKFWQLFMIPGDLGNDASKYKNGIFGFQVSAASQGNNAAAQLLQYGTSEDALSLAKKINSIQKYFIERTRLGIPIIAFDESLHGLVRSGATSFPQAIGLAATWDTALMKQVATAIAKETKFRGIRDVLTPVINIASDVRWGRTEETYGEDPFLSSEMAVAYVSPFEKNGIITTPKHFIANVGDGGRDSYPIHFNERLLDEVYLPPFKAAIERGGSRSIMTAYNSLDGSPSTASDWLLNQKLKKGWQFKGFVISDASAVGGANVLHYTAKDYADAGAKAITKGLDVIFQTDYNHHTLFIEPFLNGQINPKRIDDAVSRVLRAKFELGLFEDPYVSEREAEKWVVNTSHKAIAKEAALKSIVLLKNDNKVLPLNKKIKSLAVIGPDAVEARLGGYSGPGNQKISILEGIREKLGDAVQVNYAEGCGRKSPEWKVIPAEQLSTVQNGISVKGLSAEYFSNLSFSGKPALVRIDEQINFNWTLFSPDPLLPPDNYAIRWTGIFKATANGKYKIGLDGNDGYRLYINDTLIIDQWGKQSYHTRLADHVFVRDAEYKIRVEFFETNGNAHIHLITDMDVPNHWEQQIEESVKLAQNADATIVTVGVQEGEFQDRAMLNLPWHQEELIQKLAATGKPVIVVLIAGSAVTMQNWLDKVDGLLDVWYPGEEGGRAVADVLFGDHNPAGRLPISFPISEAQLPLVYSHKPTGRGDDYNNLTGLPLFPFGYGLSYTQFNYSNIRLDKKQIKSNESVMVHATITNTGDREGDEVVQLYIRDLIASVARPVLELKGFQRIHLKAGESKDLAFKITPNMLQMLNEQMKSVVEPGEFRIMIGSSSRELWLKDVLIVN